MATQATQLESMPDQPQPIPQWGLATRIAFRFAFVYLGLYCLLTQILTGLFPINTLEVPDPSTLWPIKQIVTWVAVHLFRVKTELVYFSGSGDKTFDWVLAFCLLIFSVIATAVWSAVDRKRPNYVTLHKWFRLFIRFCLVGQMFGYGLAKVIPLQMPFPRLTKLIEPTGNLSPMGALWFFIGASPAYEIFAGSAETLGGLLLIFPRTTMLGALISLADMIQVFVLNMAYDTPVKLFSFHLILISLVLLAPDLKRLVRLFVMDRATEASTEPSLFRSPRRNRWALIAQIALGLFLLGMNVYESRALWYQYGGGSPKSAFYGIWDVDQLSIDGQLRPPLLTDNDRWRRVIFEIPDRVVFQRMNESLSGYDAAMTGNDLTLTKYDDKNFKADFIFQRPAPDQLILDGTMDKHKVHMQLQLFDRNKFLLVSRGFHWVQEYPFNR